MNPNLMVPMDRTDLGGRAWYAYQDRWIPDSELIHAALVEELTWEGRAIQAMGKSVMQPRLIAWASGVPYRYSGQTLEPRPFTPTTHDLLNAVMRHTGVPYNHVLFNRYRDGQDHMGMHADDEPELGRCPTIAALSLGVRRRFVLMPKRKGVRPRRVDLWLEPGSLLVMGGTIQHRFRHGVPKQASLQSERINVTFRLLVSNPREAATQRSSKAKRDEELGQNDPTGT